MSLVNDHHITPASPLPLRTKLLTLLPGAIWLPNDLFVPDIESPHQSDSSSRIFSRRKIALHRGDTDKKKKGVKRNNAPPYYRKHNLSGIKLPGDDGEILTHAQAQSLFFAKLPRELRDMVYSFVIGDAPVVHLTLGAKKQRFAHFLCCEETEQGQGNRQCGCSVFNLRGRRGSRLDGGILGLMRGCRRLYVTFFLACLLAFYNPTSLPHFFLLVFFLFCPIASISFHGARSQGHATNILTSSSRSITNITI
jgi:hypothetical protein